MKRLLIIGAGGHGRVIADIAKLSDKYDQICFIDDANISKSGGTQVLGKMKDIDLWLGESEFFVAIGDNQTRAHIIRFLESKAARLSTHIHPSAVVANDVQIGLGSVVMANAVINCGSQIGKGVIINTAATIDHDNELHDCVHVSPGARLAGTVRVGETTWIGIGAIVSNNVHICQDCIIGAGAVVTRSIDTPGAYVGIPAKLMEKNR